jgi:hypothetical protein
MIKAWVPFPELVPKLTIENPGAKLQQQVGAPLIPTHLSFLDHPLAHHLIDGRFGKSG